MDEREMDEILADILHKTNPKLYTYLALLFMRGITGEQIMARVATRLTPNSLTYQSIQSTLNVFQRKMEEKRGNSQE